MRHLLFPLCAAFVVSAAGAAPTQSTCKSFGVQLLGSALPVGAYARPATHTKTKRFIASNHKTGTYLATCACSVLKNQFRIPCKFTGGHTNGNGIVADIFSVNMVRDPFEMVFSGYGYHRNSSRPEAFTKWPMGSKSAMEKGGGVGQAFEKYSRWCEATKMNVSGSLSLRAAYRQMPLRDALVLETLRATYRDMPNMLAAAKRCHQIGFPSSTSGGGCANILLDNVMSNYTEGWAAFHQAFGLPANMTDEMAAAFAATCDPHSPTSTMMKHEAEAGAVSASNHMTQHGSAREHAIVLLHDIDRRFLDETLTNLQRSLEDYGAL